MRYQCTPETDLHELIGKDGSEGFEYGPLAHAMKHDEELVLEGSDMMPRLLVTKIRAVLAGLFIVETEETLRAPAGFRLILH